MKEVIIGLAILYVFLWWIVRILILEVDSLKKENRELIDSNRELLEVNYKLTKK